MAQYDASAARLLECTKFLSLTAAWPRLPPPGGHIPPQLPRGRFSTLTPRTVQACSWGAGPLAPLPFPKRFASVVLCLLTRRGYAGVSPFLGDACRCADRGPLPHGPLTGPTVTPLTPPRPSFPNFTGKFKGRPLVSPPPSIRAFCVPKPPPVTTVAWPCPLPKAHEDPGLSPTSAPAHMRGPAFLETSQRAPVAPHTPPWMRQVSAV